MCFTCRFETPLSVCLSVRLSVFLSSLWAVSYAVRLSQSQQCVADTGEKEKRAIWTGSHCSSDHTGRSQNSSPNHNNRPGGKK